VSMFAQSGVLIILLLIIDFMLRKKVRAVVRYCIWMLVFIKLILPPTLSLPTGIGYWCGNSLFPKKIISKPITDNTSNAESIMPDMSEDTAMSTEPSQARPSRPLSTTMTPAVTSVSNLPPITWQAIVFLFWLVGIFVFVVLLIQRMLSILGLIAQSKPTQGRLLEALDQCRRQVGIGRNVELRLSSHVQSPAVCGFFNPVILMPTTLLEELSKDKLRAVLIHELVHIKRCDLWVNFVQTFLQIIYFYNPFVWLANAMVRRIREQAVDERVLVTLGAEAKSYSNTLIDIAEMAFFKTSFGLRLIGVAESNKSIHRRIKHMLSRPIPKSAKIGVFGVVTIITLAAVLLPMAAAARNKEVAAESSELTEPEFNAILQNGVTVELVAVCKYGGASTEWWRPDGTELAKEIRIKKGGTVAASGKAYAVAVKVKGPENICVKWGKIEGAIGLASLEVVDSQGQAISNMRAQKVNIDEKLTTTSIRLGVAAGDWETKAEHNGKGMRSTGIEGGGVAFSEAYESNGVVKINVSDDCLNLNHRIIAIDKEGTEHVPQRQTWTSVGKVRQTMSGFHNLTLNQIREFQYQTRPYQWATFKNVSLKPGAKTDVQVGNVQWQDCRNPAWSNDGQYIFFAGKRDDTYDLWRMRQDGTDLKRISNYPSGRKVWGVSSRPNSDDIYYLDNSVSGLDFHWIVKTSADKWQRTPLLMVPGGDGFTGPSFSPDGSRFCFNHQTRSRTGERYGRSIIKIANADGSNVRTVMEYEGKLGWIAWGRGEYSGKIVYTKPVDGVRSVFMINTDGSNEVRITQKEQGTFGPLSFSPDGKWLVSYGEDVNICILKPDGSNYHKINEATVQGLHYAFSPDGTKITYATKSNEQYSIKVIVLKNVSLKPGTKTDVQVGKLQSLIDAAKPGDTVTVPKGIYKEPVEIFKSLTLKGESRTECIFELTANRPAIFIDTKGKGKVMVQDLTIKWQLATSDKGIERPFALGVKDAEAEIKNCVFLPLGNFQRSPVAVRADGFSNLNIEKSRFEGFEYVICYGQGTKGKTTDCLIMNCGHQGIINYSGATLYVERNVITGSKYHAVRCTGGTLHVKDNLLINNANRGIYLGNRSGSGTITNNLIINNAVGIGAFASAKYEVKNNVIADSTYSGIGMYKSCYLTIRDNIFLNNERGWVMFDKSEKGANTSYRNTFWKNRVDDENFSKTANSINADPGFMDPKNGDFSLKPGPAKENKQGLTNPQVFKALWKIWKNRKDKNVPFTK
jgi:beta-lactamase regulating signal transducer with metallopeptidase domain/Tol biopolymer transport system component